MIQGQGPFGNTLSAEDVGKRLAILGTNVFKPVRELYDGIRTGALPWGVCLGVALPLQVLLFFRLDYFFISRTSFVFLYPTKIVPHYLYYYTVVSTPFWAWAIIQCGIKRRLTARLTETFRSCGLQNRIGKLPNLIFDRPIDHMTRRLRVTRAALSMDAFENAKGALSGALQIFIDDIRENVTTGTVDLIYSPYPLSSLYRRDDYEHIPRGEFVVGTTRSKELRANLHDVPHILVAGQTRAGKSTFLRQFLTTLYLNDRTAMFTLIDLKGGLESDTFEELPRMKSLFSTEEAASVLKTIKEELGRRMKVLKANKCSNITEFLRIKKEDRKNADGISHKIAAHRHIIAIDEIAEIFLAGGRTSGGEVKAAKDALSQIARQGAALGVHLVVATQRPDSATLDPQIKANLVGVLCFQMVNDASSITVLGNGRATDLPPLRGRGIWKNGMDMVEVQVPLIEKEEAKELLAPYKVVKSGEPLAISRNGTEGIDLQNSVVSSADSPAPDPIHSV